MCTENQVCQEDRTCQCNCEDRTAKLCGPAPGSMCCGANEVCCDYSGTLQCIGAEDAGGTPLPEEDAALVCADTGGTVQEPYCRPN
jgi:hypothetical protein